MDVLTSETCWALNNEIKKQVTSVSLYSTSRESVYIFTQCASLLIKGSQLNSILNKEIITNQ